MQILKKHFSGNTLTAVYFSHSLSGDVFVLDIDESMRKQFEYELFDCEYEHDADFGMMMPVKIYETPSDLSYSEIISLILQDIEEYPIQDPIYTRAKWEAKNPTLIRKIAGKRKSPKAPSRFGMCFIGLMCKTVRYGTSLYKFVSSQNNLKFKSI